MTTRLRPLLRGATMAALAIAAAALITHGLRAPDGSAVTSFLLGGVLVSAWLGGWAGGLFAAVLAIAAFDFIFLPPQHQFPARDLNDVAELGLFGFAALTMIALDTARRRLTHTRNLLDAERRYRALLESAPDAVVVADAAGRILLVNSQTERLFGYAREELLGQPVELLLPETLRAGHQRQWAGYAAAPGARLMASEQQLSARRKDGSLVSVEISLSPLAEGEDLLVTAVIRDVSERRRQELRLASAVQAAGLGSWEWDLQQNQVIWSEEAHHLFGVAPGGLGATLEAFLALVHPDDRERMRRAMPALRDGVPGNFEYRIVRPDGAVRAIQSRSAAFTDPAGRALRIIGAVQDITERQQTEAQARQLIQEQAARAAAQAGEQRARFLAEASAAMGQSLDAEALLDNLAHLAVARLADWCIVYLRDSDGTVRRVALHHASALDPQAAHLLEHLAPSDGGLPGLYQAMEAGGTVFIPEFAERHLARFVHSPDHLQLAQAVGIRSVIAVPLQARGRVFGTIAFVAARGTARFGREDLALAEDLARQAGLAVDNARLYQAEQRERAAAVRAADRTARLQAITAALAGTVTPEQAATVLVEQGRGALGAAAGALALLDEAAGEVEVVQTLGHEPERMGNAVRRYGLRHPLERRAPLSDVVRTAVPIWARSQQDMAARYDYLNKEAQSSPYRAWAIVPLLTDGRAVGALAFNFTEPQAFDEADRSFILTLAEQCAQALERAHLYRLEQEARAAAERAADRTARLQAVSAALAQTLTAGQVAGVIVQQSVAALGAAASTLTLREEDGETLSLARGEGYAPETLERWKTFPLAARLPVSDAVREGRPVWLPTTSAWAEQYPDISPAEPARQKSWAVVPLLVSGRAAGALVLAYAEERPFDEDEQALILTVAQQCAQALERAQLFVAEQQARAAAESERRRLTAVLNQIPEAVIIVDASGGLLLINPAAREMARPWQADAGTPAGFGHLPAPEGTVTEMGGLPYLRPDGQPVGVEDLPLVRALRGETVIGKEVALPLTEGKLVSLLISAAPIYDESGQIAGAVSVGEDITLRKTLEQLKDEFLSLAAHELKTPLTSVRGYSQLLLRRARRGASGLNKQEANLVETIDERSRYMEGLINELLDLSRIETGRLMLHPEPLDLAALLRQVVGHQRALRAEAQFALEGAGEPLWGVGDRGRLEQVFTNLLDNAATYSPPGSAITVRLTGCDGQAVATVSDPGIGIPAADLPHLFERHYRASNVGPTPSGLGLGLYLTRQIVERHGGSISAASVEGQGSTFTVTLPLAGAEDPASAPSSAAAGEPA